MGSSTSKQARKLPTSKITRASTNLKSNKQQNIKLQQHQQRHGPIGLDPNVVTQKDKDMANADNKNVNKIGQIRIEEIPFKLDENHPSLKALKNRQKREEELAKQRKEQESSTESQTNQTVHPSTLIGIIEDLKTRSKDEIKRSYNLNDEFLNILGDQLSIAKTRVEIQAPKNDDKLDQDKINGIQSNRKQDLEDELEKFMSGGTKR